MTKLLGSGLVVAAIVMVAVACSGSVDISFGTGETADGVAEDLIENEIADQIGAGPLVATCEKPASEDVGEEFRCSAEGAEYPVQFVAVIDREEHVDVTSTNVVSPEGLGQLESSAATSLNDQVGSLLAAEDIDCGQAPLVVAPDNGLDCLLTDPFSGAVYDMLLTITDFEAGTFSLDVADRPRP